MKLISAASIALAVVLSSSGGLLPSGAQAQPSIQIGPGGIRVDDGRGRRGGGQCEELRLACENKDRLGVTGWWVDRPRTCAQTRDELSACLASHVLPNRDFWEAAFLRLRRKWLISLVGVQRFEPWTR